MNLSEKIARRDWLKLAAAGVLGTSASGWLASLAAAVPAGARPKSCILLWMNGGPSQGHTFDLKEGGQFRSIETNVPGIRISEYLPRMAQQMNHVALVRGMSTGEVVHERARFLMHTGYRQRGASQYAGIGCIASAEMGRPDFDLPNFVTIDGGVEGNNAGGPFRSVPAYLGPRHAPLAVTDPNRGVDNLRPFVGLPELDERAALVDRGDQRFMERYDAASILAHRTTYQRAVRLLRSDNARAFDLDRETQATRDAYGSSQFGRACLLARRLVEVGTPFIEVTLGGWDDHSGAAGPIRSRSPYMDQAMAALVADLHARGLLQTTLVIWMGEFGRSPGTGAAHYARAWTLALAGCGLKTGQAVGRTSARGDTVEERPVNAPDFLATVCRALGIDTTRQYTTRDARPINLVERGATPVRELFA